MTNPVDAPGTTFGGKCRWAYWDLAEEVPGLKLRSSASLTTTFSRLSIVCGFSAVQQDANAAVKADGAYFCGLSCLSSPGVLCLRQLIFLVHHLVLYSISKLCTNLFQPFWFDGLHQLDGGAKAKKELQRSVTNAHDCNLGLWGPPKDRDTDVADVKFSLLLSKARQIGSSLPRPQTGPICMRSQVVSRWAFTVS